MLKYAHAVILASFALGGCGGGTSDGSANLPYAPLNSLVVVDEAEEAYRRAVVSSVANNATHYLRGDRLVWDADGEAPARSTFECDGPSCVEAGFMLSSSRDWRSPERLVLLQRVNNVPRVVGVFASPDSIYSLHDYGGWMEHSTFASVSYHIGGEDHPAVGTQYTNGLAMGISNGQDPDPSLDGATWQGFVVGRDHTILNYHGNAVTGEAYVTLNSGDGGLEVDVWLTRLHNVEERLDDMRWLGLELENGGFARRDAEDDWIAGQYFGPVHEEVAGVFERAGINGAFGGRK